MKRTPLLAAVLSSILAAAFTVACGGESNNLPPPPPPPPPPPTTTPIAAPPPAADADASAAPTAPTTPPTLTEGTASPDPVAPTPTVKFLSPSPTKIQIVKADKAADLEVKLDVKNWLTATGSSHVHLILDNKPYKAIYDPKKPIKLSELLGGAAIEEGQHVLVAFPSRANHESVKTKGALAIVQFVVGNGKETDVKAGSKEDKAAAEPPTNLQKPILVYSRPKGEYKGDMASHVLVDFQLIGDTLAEGKDHVAITVTGPGIPDKLTANVTKFGAPSYLDNLQDGEYTVKLDLLDKDGKPVAGSTWNSTTRTIKINHAAQAEAMPGMSMPGATPAASSSAPAPAGSSAPKK